MKLLICTVFLFFGIWAEALRPSLIKNMTMENYTPDSAIIANLLTDVYFKGIYEGDVPLLQTIYYPGTLLFGDESGKSYYKTLAEYLDGVKNRQSPKETI